MLRHIALCLSLVVARQMSCQGQATRPHRASDSTLLAKIRAQQEILKNNKVGSPFPDISTLATYIDGKRELLSSAKPKFIFLGYYSCAPCRFEVPIMARLAAEKRYKGYDFWYLTFDDSADIAEEFANIPARHKSHITIASIPRNIIDSLGLAYGYPTKYMVDHNNIVRVQSSGGRTDDASKAKQELEVCLDQLR